MTNTKQTMLALLLSATVAIGLAGCTQSASSTTSNNDTKNTATSEQNVQLNQNQPGQSSTQTADANNQQPQDPYANDASIQEVRKAYNIGSEYITVTSVSISGIAMGKMELPIEKDQSLVLAKALTSAIVNSGWEQGAPPPGLFVNRDGSEFYLGMKKKNGDLTLETFQYQSDKTYKSVKKQVKKS